MVRPPRSHGPWLLWLLGLALLFGSLCAVQGCVDRQPRTGVRPRPLVLSKDLSTARLDPHMELLEDPTRALGIEDVAAAVDGGRFEPLGRPLASLGRSRSAYWVRLRLHNPTDEPLPFYLMMQWPRLSSVEFYQPRPDGTFRHHRSGLRVPFDERPLAHPTHVLPFTVPARSAEPLYIRVASETELLLLSILRSPSAFALGQLRFMVGIGLYYGMLLALAAYNLILFFQLRHRYYLWYIGAIASFTVMWFSNSGFIGLWPWIAQGVGRIELVSLALWAFFRLGFSRSFLRLSDVAPTTNRVLGALQWIATPAWALTLALGPVRVTDPWAMPIALCFAVATLVAGLQARQANVRLARWYVEATSLLATGMFIAVLVFSGAALHPLLAGGSILLATLIELFVLSLALSERVRTLTQQREQALRQIETERLSALQSIVGGVTHELNSPLGSLRSAAESMERAGKLLIQDDPSAAAGGRARERAVRALPELLKVVHSATDRIGHVVRALYNFANVDTAERGELVLQTALDNTLVLLRGSLGNIETTVRCGEVPPVPCRPAEINQVFMAIMKNAVEAMPEGGTLSVETELVQGRRGPLARVCIRDTGVGIPPGQLKRIFEPRFSRTGERVRMTLGLSTAKRIIDAHGGELSIRANRDGIGTEVAIALPL